MASGRPGPSWAAREGAGLATASFDAGTIAIRDDATGDGRTIEGIAVPYGVETDGPVAQFPGRRERFRAAAFAAIAAARGDRPLPVVDRHTELGGTVIGGVRIWDSPEGLRYEGRLLGNQAARDFAEAAAAGLVRPSIEFAIGAFARRGDVVEHYAPRALAALAFTHRPAYSTTTVAIREDNGGNSTMNCDRCGAALLPGVAHTCAPDPTIHVQTAADAALAARGDALAGSLAAQLQVDPTTLRELVAEAADEAVRRQRGGDVATREASPFDGYTSLGELIQAAAAPDADPELRTYAARALDDIVSTSGANAGMVTANTFGGIRRLVDRGRPAITAFGGPAPLVGDGMDFGYPYFDGTLTDLVGAQSAQKAEITSAVVDIKRATVTIGTYAGGADIAYQLIRRSTSDYLTAWGSIILAAWAAVTEAAFVTALEAGSVTGDFTEALASVDATELKNLFVDASVAIEAATGQPAEFVLAGTNAFKAAAKLMTPLPIVNAAGSSNARTLEVNVAGLPVIHVSSMTTAKFVASNRLAARWHEDGPFQVSADEVAKLGKDVAYWSLGAAAVYVPAGVIEIYDVTP